MRGPLVIGPDSPGIRPAGAAGEGLRFDQLHARAELSQRIGNSKSDQTSADNENVGSRVPDLTACSNQIATIIGTQRSEPDGLRDSGRRSHE